MTVRTFVDTNVLVYARDERDPAKQKAAIRWLEHLWSTHRAATSFQALSEFYATVTLKWQPPVPPELARGDLRRYLAWRPEALDAETIEDAWRLQDRYRLAWWDATIVAAARRSGSRFLLSEDFQDQQDLDGVTVLNPFKHAPD